MIKKPSGSMMNRLVPCPGSLKLCSDYPEEPGDNQEADKGITAHWVAADCLESHRQPKDWLGKNPINDQVVDAEMVEHVTGYSSFIRNLFGDDHSGCVENRLKIDGFEGTPDYLRYDMLETKVTIFDLKYGFVGIEVFENWQFMSYFWLWWMNNQGSFVTEVEFVIYQPRAYHPDGAVRKWSTSLDDLVENYFPQIIQTLTNVHLPDAITLSGKHCHYCSAMLNCRANLETCLNIINVSNINCVDEPDNWILGKQLEMFEHAQSVLKQRVNVLRVVGESRVKSGEVVPGYGMAPSSGHRSWKMSDKKAKVLGVPYKPQEIMTPRQAELNGFPKSLVKANTVTKSKLKFVKVDTQQRAKQLFGKSERVR